MQMASNPLRIERSANQTADVKVSVVLLVKNGMPDLAELLRRLMNQDFDEPFEIVAVDSGSTDGSLEALRNVGARVHRIRPSEFRFGPTRQLAFSLTRAPIIITLSQDVLPLDDRFLEQMIAPIRSRKTDLVRCQDQLPEGVKNFWVRQNQLYTIRIFPDLPDDYWISCHCLAISREAWEKTGFGQTPMSEDKYLAQSAFKLRLRTFVIQQPLILHGHDYNLQTLMKRFYNEGIGARWAGGRFNFRDMLKALGRIGIWRWTVRATLRREITTPAEVLFCIVQPLMLWLGYRFGKKYWK
jgi:rhamnosyltransferase